MQNNNICAAYECRERTTLSKIFAKYGIENYMMTDSGSFCGYDAKFKTAKGSFIAEVKVRDIESTKYADAYIDKYKIDNLLKAEAASGITAILVYVFNDGVFYLIPAKDVAKCYNQTVTANKCTAASTTNKIQKNVYSILLNEYRAYNI